MYSAYYRLGQIALLYRDIEQAESYFIQSMYEELEAKSYYQLSKIYIMKNDKVKATLYINKAIEEDNKYYKIAIDEPIFLPIKKQIVQAEENKNVKKESNKETIISNYLDDTYTLTKLMNDRKNK